MVSDVSKYSDKPDDRASRVHGCIYRFALQPQEADGVVSAMEAHAEDDSKSSITRPMRREYVNLPRGPLAMGNMDPAGPSPNRFFWARQKGPRHGPLTQQPLRSNCLVATSGGGMAAPHWGIASCGRTAGGVFFPFNQNPRGQLLHYVS